MLRAKHNRKMNTAGWACVVASFFRSRHESGPKTTRKAVAFAGKREAKARRRAYGGPDSFLWPPLGTPYLCVGFSTYVCEWWLRVMAIFEFWTSVAIKFAGWSRNVAKLNANKKRLTFCNQIKKRVSRQIGPCHTHEKPHFDVFKRSAVFYWTRARLLCTDFPQHSNLFGIWATF